MKEINILYTEGSLIMKKIILSISFILFCLGAVGVRIFELLNMLDKQSGFYLKQYTLLSVILGFIAFIGCVNFAIGAIITLKNESKERTIPNSSIVLGISSLLMALSIFYDVGKLSLNTTYFTWSDYSLFGLSIISALAFTVLGICYFAGKKFPMVLSLFPVIWSVTRLIVSYTKFNGIALASENIVDVLTMSFFMVFWLYHTKILGDQSLKKSLLRIFLFGSCTSFLGLISTIPRFFAEYGMRVDLVSIFPTISLSNLAGAIYAICFIGMIYLQKVEKVSTNLTETDEQNSTISRPQFTVEVIEDFESTEQPAQKNIENIENI